MKLLRHGPRGQEKPGLLDASGTIRDLSAHVADITPDVLSRQNLAKLAKLDPKSLPAVPGTPRYGVPVNGISKFLAIGTNFSDHAREANMPIPSEPPVFSKFVSCLNGPNDDVMLPKEATKADWEVELGFFIGTEARHVPESEALDYIAGYVLVNDVSERA